MSPLYLAVGLLNIWAQRSNFGINSNNTGMDIRVRRDTHVVDISPNNYNTDSDSVREKRETALSYIHNRVPDTDYNKHNAENNTYNNLKNNHTSRKRGRHNNGLYVPHKRSRNHFNFTQNDRNRIQYNTTGFRLDSLRLDSNTPNENNQINVAYRNAASISNAPGYAPKVLPIATTSKPWYSKLWSAISGQKTATTSPRNEILRPKTQANYGVIKKRKRIKMGACVICNIPCPAGYHKEQSFCVEDDHDYE